MELLDVYDENGKFLGKFDRNVVHREAMWHNTVHCWLFDNDGSIYFQMRKGEGLYTTASGHIKAGETIKEGFKREIFEEIGLNVSTDSAIPVEINKFSIDLIRKDGSLFRDRAFAHIYLYNLKEDYSNFDFDEHEIDGLVKLNAQDVLNLFNEKYKNIEGIAILQSDNKHIKTMQNTYNIDSFLINEGETAIGKYGKILNKVVEITKN